MTLTIITAENDAEILTFTVGSAAESTAIVAHLRSEGYTVRKSAVRGAKRSKVAA